MKGWGLLGRYENFPIMIHGVTSFTHQYSTIELQLGILHTLHRLNQETRNLNVLSPPSTSKCEVSFEFGVAEGITFNYLDEGELKRFQKSIPKEAPPTLDFLCVLRYHTLKEAKRVPLRFDYHLLRFVFHGKMVEMQIFHERGIRRVSLEDLTDFIIGQIREELPQLSVHAL